MHKWNEVWSTDEDSGTYERFYLAHPECLNKARNEYESFVYTCPACRKKSGPGRGQCSACGHPRPDWLEIRHCEKCRFPLVQGLGIKYDYGYGSYVHKICYKQIRFRNCFLATALYGEDSSKVRMLCFFRDEYLSASSLGRAFIALYVRFSPPLARAIAKESLLRTLVRYCIVAPALLFTEKFLAYAGRKEKLKQ